MKFKTALTSILAATTLAAGAARADEGFYFAPSASLDVEMTRWNADGFLENRNSMGYTLAGNLGLGHKKGNWNNILSVGLGVNYNDGVTFDEWSATTESGVVITDGDRVGPPRGKNETPEVARKDPIWSRWMHNPNAVKNKGEKPYIQMPGTTNTVEVSNVDYGNLELSRWAIVPSISFESIWKNRLAGRVTLDAPIRRATQTSYMFASPNVETFSEDTRTLMGPRISADLGYNLRHDKAENPLIISIGAGFEKNKVLENKSLNIGLRYHF